MNNTEKRLSEGLCGLVNLGNTCFINTILQILSHAHELNTFLEKEDYMKKLKNKFESLLLVEWDQLRKRLWKETKPVSPDKFILTLHNLARIKKMDMFTDFSQNDATEFLMFLIDCFHTSLSREVTMTVVGTPVNEKDKWAIQCYEMVQKMYSKDFSEIWQLFYGIHLTHIVSPGGAILSTSSEPFFTIHLSIPDHIKNPSLLDCFEFYVDGETLEGDNAWYNEAIQAKEPVVKKKTLFWSLPILLVVDLKRINKYNFKNKNQMLVDFPLDNLDLSRFVTGYRKESYVYDLFGIANHYGGTQGGHYTAFVNTKQGWFHFNDTQVIPITDISKLITPHAYCFFYRKRKEKK
jgi:ubiquitin carboxyl-terminal hydrolase 8